MRKVCRPDARTPEAVKPRAPRDEMMQTRS